MPDEKINNESIGSLIEIVFRLFLAVPYCMSVLRPCKVRYMKSGRNLSLGALGWGVGVAAWSSDVTMGDTKVEKKPEGTCSLLDTVAIMVPLVLLNLSPEQLRTTILVYPLGTITRLLNEIPVLVQVKTSLA